MQANNHDYMMTPIRETIARSAPTINFAGQGALDNALDENLQAALTGSMTAEEAMVNTEKAWTKLLSRRQEESVAAIQASLAAWPSIID